MAEKTRGQVAIAHPPLLQGPDIIFRMMTSGFGIKIMGECMGQAMVQAHIGLKMVMNLRSLDSIENGIDMGLPKIGRFEIPKRYQVLGGMGHYGSL